MELLEVSGSFSKREAAPKSDGLAAITVGLPVDGQTMRANEGWSVHPSSALPRNYSGRAERLAA